MLLIYNFVGTLGFRVKITGADTVVNSYARVAVKERVINQNKEGSAQYECERRKDSHRAMG